MASFVRGLLQSRWTPWVITWVILLFLYLDASGRLAGDDQLAYAAASARLTTLDRSQALHMRLEAQYPGPLQDTTIERWRDPVDGAVCYIYLPIAVEHQQGPNNLVQYGSSTIGSISCYSGRGWLFG